jgi:hypothetical protein
MVVDRIARLTVRASTPEDDLGFVDAEPMVVGGLQASPGPHRTVDIHGETTVPTDEVVVVVVDPVLVTSGRAGRLDPANEPAIGQDSEGVVHRLT